MQLAAAAPRTIKELKAQMNIKRPRPPATTAGGGARTHTQRTLDALITSNTGSMKTLEAELVD
tara:strand:+ start:249 stop:437 length:189 start_codon:yes stop_codon:yes gene_type:complete